MTKAEILEQIEMVQSAISEGEVLDNVEQIEILLDNIAEYLTAERKGKDIENGRCGQLLNMLRAAPKGISKSDILATMKINKGNLASLIAYLRRAGVEIFKIGDKIVLGQYVKIGESV